MANLDPDDPQGVHREHRAEGRRGADHRLQHDTVVDVVVDVADHADDDGGRRDRVRNTVRHEHRRERVRDDGMPSARNDRTTTLSMVRERCGT
jgi:hypothetical protein